MENGNTCEQLNEQWERAAERAAQDQARERELDSEELKQASGIKVESGIRAGRLPLTAYGNCTYPIEICP